jgi:hypothetical protein
VIGAIVQYEDIARICSETSSLATNQIRSSIAAVSAGADREISKICLYGGRMARGAANDAIEALCKELERTPPRQTDLIKELRKLARDVLTSQEYLNAKIKL